MTLEYVCPVHGHERKRCGKRCAKARRVLAKLVHDFAQYWFDRRRGVKALSVGEYRIRYGGR
jgi:hypothetical protein